MGERKKKEKITYIDDGRTIADRSGVTGGFHVPKSSPSRYRASLKEQWQTFFAAFKMMLAPMLVVVGGIVVIYLILTFVFLVL